MKLQKGVSTCFLLFVIFCFMAVGGNKAIAGEYLPEHVWPLTGTGSPDLPMSSAFGPRLKASENFRYDFHRGVDIPAQFGTPVYAIADGVIRLAGDYSFYTDPVVQIRHYKPGDAPRTCSNRGCYYSNYMHLSGVSVSPGDAINKGDLIGYTGVSASGFPHLHFEIRDRSIYQKYCINPWKVLPYQDTLNLDISFVNDPDFSEPLAPVVEIQVASPADELDFNRVEVEIFDISNGSEESLDLQSYDIEEWNYLYTLKSNPNLYLDDPDFNGIEVSPEIFNAREDTYIVRFRFHELQMPYVPSQARVMIRAFDVNGNSIEDSFEIVP